MTDWYEKLRDTAFKVGRSAQKDPRMLKAALKVKETVEAFQQGYREQREPELHKTACPHCQADLPPKARFCPQCGAQVD